MLRTLLYGLAALTFMTLSGPVSADTARQAGAAPALVHDAVWTAGPGSAGCESGLTLARDGAEHGAIRLAQTLRARPAEESRMPRRVPRGQTFHIQREGQRGFDSFSAGSVLPTHDCVEVNCPASFPAGATCWRCIKQAE